MPIDFTPSSPKIDFTPAGGMSQGNADKMKELYPESDPTAKPPIDFKPVAKPIDFKPVAKAIDFKPAATEGVGEELLRRGGRTFNAATDDLKSQFTKPFQKDNSPGPEVLQRVGDVASRALGTVGDVVEGVVGTPVKAVGETAMNRILVPPEKRGQPAVEKAVQDAGDLLTSAAVVPGPLKGLGKVAAAEAIASAAKRDAEGIKVGAKHADIPGNGEEGFVDKKGKFLTREQAETVAVANKQIVQPETEPGKLHSEDIGRPKPITAQSVSDDLYKLTGEMKAKRIEEGQFLKGIETVPNSTWEKLYAFKDDPASVKLTDQEKQIYDQTIPHVESMRKEAYEYLTKKGYSFDDDVDSLGRAPRQVKGRGTPMDALTGTKTIGGKGSLTTKAGLARPRSMFAMEGPQGRQVVYVNPEGDVYATTKSGLGDKLGNVDKPSVGEKISNGSELKDATTAEIEANTKGLEYHKNLIGNEYTSAMQGQRAMLNAKFIEDLKKSPDFSEVAEKFSSKRNPPAGWKAIPGAPQLREYAFRPDIAEAVEDFLGDVKNPDELAKGLYKTGQLMKASIFWNPVPHMRNATNFFFTDKGAFGTVAGLPKTLMLLPKAAKAAFTQDKVYTQYLRDGASLPGADRGAQMFNDELKRVMGLDAKVNAGGFKKIADAFGYSKVEDMIKGIYGVSNKVLWSYSDMLSILRSMELEAKGMSRSEAIDKMEKVMPNYRVPTRVGGTGDVSRMASKALQSPATSLFGRYQYNRLKAYANIVKDAVGKDKSIKDRAEALDKMAMLGFLGLVYYPIMDKVYQHVLNNPDASVDRPGLLKLPQIAGDIASGKKTYGQGIMSAVSPGLLSTPVELATGRNLYTGKDIVDRQDVSDGNIGRVGYDLGKYAASKFSPVEDASRLYSGDIDLKEFLASQVGVKSPTDEQISKANKAQKYSRRQQKSDAKKRGF